MKSIRLLLLTIFILTNYLSMCQEKNDDRIVHGPVIRVSLNKQVDVSLENFADGGYFWYIAQYDTTKIVLIDSSRITKHPDRTGSSQIQYWTFKGIEKGESQLVFYLKRPWLDDIERKQYYTVLVE